MPLPGVVICMVSSRRSKRKSRFSGVTMEKRAAFSVASRPSMLRVSSLAVPRPRAERIWEAPKRW